MNILTQTLKNINNTKHFNILNKTINDFTQPILDPTDPFNYAKLVQDMNLFSDSFCRSTGTYYCPADIKAGLFPRQRYDNVIISLAYESYSDSNSMIKVGKMLGNLIYSKFSLNDERVLYHIPRQTIHNFLKRVKSIETPVSPSKDTPETLYVIADEKFIPIQKSKTNKDTMVKVAVIFKGKSLIKGSKNRYELNDKEVVICDNKTDIWDTVSNAIESKYDYTKIKKIYVMGECASWINQGAYELKTSNTKTEFVLDKFHFMQAIQNITKDKVYKELLVYYSINNMRKDFKRIIEIIKEDNTDRIETIDLKSQYILKRLSSIEMMYKVVKIGCPVEQAISHVVASTFTSVPKAYSIDRLPTYLNSRQNQQNGHDIRSLVFEAIKQNPKEKNKEITINKDTYDFSFLDNRKNDYTYRTNKLIKNINKDTKYF